MKTLVDTCVISEVQRRQGHPLVRQHFESLAAKDIYFSVLTFGELRKGIERLKANAKKKSLEIWFHQLILAAHDRILPVDQETALIWGEVAAQAERQGRSIPAIDGLLAATALRFGLRLMTRNEDDFEATGVLVFNPWK
ncbi:MAG TPA: VapC toxin family PIN domain ribonuclease [Planctomycetaceae bacterium]|nr:VapC toxin family PIN domain ribonuclease [Planctomycetaceae bacterium]